MNWGRAWLLFESLRYLAPGRAGPLVSPRLGWSVAALVVAVWSGLCAAAYGLILLIGNWAITGASYAATWNVGVVEFVTATLNVLHGISHIMVATVWAIVSLAVLGVTWFLTTYRLNRAR